MNALLEVQDLSINVPGRTLIAGLSFNVHAGSLVALVGPSGSGKTSLLMCVAGYLPPSRGKVVLAPTVRIGWAQQNSPILVRRSILHNVAVAALLAGQSESQSVVQAGELLEVVGLDAERTTRAGQLSGGERQRLVLARSLAGQCEVIMADEPTASLDAHSRDLVVDALQAASKRGAGVVVATHDLKVAELADHVVTMELQ